MNASAAPRPAAVRGPSAPPRAAASAPRRLRPRFPAAAWVFLFTGWIIAPLAARAAPWPAADSNLPPHPALREGTLPNGLRWVVLPHAVPRDRVSLRLLVAVGSAHERDDELGLAHFVEHMAFRGTRAHPAGSLTAALQRLGVGLGPDNAAFTSYESTIYHLELPDATAATLREGLHVFREYAEAVTFDPPLIEKERGVVLSELATRDVPLQRSGLALQALLWPGARLARRPVSGTPATLRTFTQAQFRAFYDAWYRPERMAVIVVGQVEPAAVVPLIEREFASLAARAPAREEPADLLPNETTSPDVAVFSDPGLLGAQISLVHAHHLGTVRDTRAVRLRQQHLGLAFSMFHERMLRIAQEPGTTLVSPVAHLGYPLRRWQTVTLAASTKINDWKTVAAELEREHRRAFQHGFTADELDTARARLLAHHQQGVRTHATWPSDWIATRIAVCLTAGTVFAHPAELERELAPALAETTLADCLDAFRAAWSTAAPVVFIAAHPSFAITRDRIAAALNTSRESPVEPRAAAAAVPFAYTDFGPPGTLAREERVPDLDVTLAAFANGVRLNFKATDFAADTVEIHVRVGDGFHSLPEHQPGLPLLANQLVPAGGLGRHPTAELGRILAGHRLHLSFAAHTDSLQFRAVCPRADLLLALQLIAAHLSDSAYRVEALRDVRAAFATMYGQMAASPGGVLSLFTLRTLAGGDRRFGTPLADELFSRDIAELKAWVEPQFRAGPLELSIVGETTWAEASAAVARTLGALPERKPRPAPLRDPAFAIPAAPLNGQSIGIDPRQPQCAVAWYWPVGPLENIRHERRLRLLAAVLSNRVHARVREELGTAYSASAGFEDTPGFPGLAYFFAYAEINPARLGVVSQILQRESAALALRGVEEDEFTRAESPYLRERADNLRTNVYWASTVLSDAQERPDRLAAARDRQSDTAAITRAELSALARRYLDPARSFKFSTLPATPAQDPAPPARPAANSKAGATPTTPPP